ncbi:flavin-containing monooxygenase [Falsiroseomonas sp. HW251]|uniref:flavin-containing monooxygenase n=1 Tax=Falsiroseomonas sp. HW251 TaxID=3390998 RepID=UPI003D3115EF
MTTRHFAVIGAGAGGLCAAKNLLARGIEVTIFEVGTRIGGLWVYNNDSGLSPAYRSLHINSEAKVSSFIDFPFEPGTPLYPNAARMERYFRDYAEHFRLTSRIRFNSRVTAIVPDGSGYRVEIEDGSAHRFDGVVVASGHQSVPRHPPQVQGFAGTYMHAHAYREPEPFTGQRVLVIGPGNSGVDIAADVCSVTAQTYLSARSPVLIMPRLMFGVPQSRILVKLERPFLPWSVRVWIRTLLTRIFHGPMEQWGFRTPKGRTHPISHPTLISMLAWDRVRAKPGIDRVDGRVVYFVDGSSEEIDTIIACTGYLTALPFLPEGTSPVRDSYLHLYNRVVSPKLPNVYFIGFFDVTGGSNIRMMDDQAEYIAAVVSGAIKVPGPAEMEQAIMADKAFQESMFPGTPRYALELDPVRYRKLLAKDYDRNGVQHTRPAPVERALLRESAA